MAAYLFRLAEPPRCQGCTAKASLQLCNTFNAHIAYYCRRCGDAALKRQLKVDEKVNSMLKGKR